MRLTALPHRPDKHLFIGQDRRAGTQGLDFRFSDGQRMWNDTVEDFMVRYVGQEYTLAYDLAREFPEAVYCKMADLGWLGLLAPEDRGDWRPTR